LILKLSKRYIKLIKSGLLDDANLAFCFFAFFCLFSVIGFVSIFGRVFYSNNKLYIAVPITSAQNNNPQISFLDDSKLDAQEKALIITVKPNEPLSYQYHNNRDEFWKILEGGGKVILNDETFETKPGDEFFIKRGTKHRAIGPLKFLEISYGNFNENDIVRVEDKYKRNQ